MNLNVLNLLKENPQLLELLSEVLKRKCQALTKAGAACEVLTEKDFQSVMGKLAKQDRQLYAEIEEEVGNLLGEQNRKKQQAKSQKPEKKTSKSKNEVILDNLVGIGQTEIKLHELTALGFHVDKISRSMEIGSYHLTKGLLDNTIKIKTKECACKANV